MMEEITGYLAHLDFFVGNELIGFVELKGAQPFESFKKIIDAQLEA